MNGNYYYNKLKIKFKNEKIFLWVIGIILYLINLDISWHFFQLRKGQDVFAAFAQLESFKIFFRNYKPNPANASSNMFILELYYYAIAVVGCRGLAKYLYEFFVKKNTFAPKKILEEDITSPTFPYDQDKLQLVIGLKHREQSLDYIETPSWLIVPEKGLHQDFLICGGKGTGKTQSCMYPFTKQMIYYKAYSPNEKAGMLILDVKGNYTKEAYKCAQEVNRESDVIVINLSGKYRYNPLYKPSLRPQVIANRLRTVLELFSTQHADSYWLDKAEVLLTQAIKLVRLYNKEYVTFVEVHKVVNIDDFLNEKIEYLQELEDRNKLTRDQKANFRTVKDYFLNEYRTLDTKISSVIKSEVTRMTQTFIDDPDILKTFCAAEDELNFFGFDDLVDTGRIVVLDMNIAEFRNLSKIIAAYLKLDFQTAAMIRLTRAGANTERPLVFISDEYQEYVTANDADFYAVSREAKCINIVSSQSYSSLLRTLKNEEILQTILTNLTNKIWLKTDDKKTAEQAVAQCGTYKKKEVQKGFSKSGGRQYSNLMGRGYTGGGGNSYTENININVKSSNKFEIETFTIELPVFKAVAYLSDGEKIIPPTIIHLEPYFKDTYTNLAKRVRPALKDTRNSIKSAAMMAKDDEEEQIIKDEFDFDSNKAGGSAKTINFDDYEKEETIIKDNDEFSFDGFDDNNDNNKKIDDTDDIFGESSKVGAKETSNIFGDDLFDDVKGEDKHSKKTFDNENLFEHTLNSEDTTDKNNKAFEQSDDLLFDSTTEKIRSEETESTKKQDVILQEKLKKIEGIFDED